MTRGLEAPPKRDTPSRIAARFTTLLVLAAGAGIVIYTAVTNQAANLTEDVRPVNLELEDTTVIDGFVTNVREDEGGPTPVVILHDVDVTGGLILDDLAHALDDAHHGVRIDLPGFGYSTRMPEQGHQHTVAGMAELVATVLEERFDEPVAVIGVGLGGEVGAELALSYPELIAGLVLVDVDFWGRERFPAGLESLPWVGKAATYTWETGGRFALSEWAPHCDEGGWCPSDADLAARSGIIEIENTTDSLHSFRRTHEAALAPENLDQISASVAYVWSTRGGVSQDTIDRLTEEIPGLVVTESDSFQAVLDDPATVTRALGELSEG
ncbi:MAG TPA: alpha/beta hydrolase [Acidimicrobiia bacterium]|nr:alpha/beta hydrolase [Acidimicrobiia bacterium]